MSTIGTESSGHVIARFSGRIHQVLDELVLAPAWSMTGDEQRTTLVELAQAEARIAELRLRVLAAADRSDASADPGASSMAAWLAHATRRPHTVARADLRLANQLDGAYTATRDGLASGAVDVAQARVIVRAVEALPESLDARLRELAQKHLVVLAREHDELALKVLGRRVLEVINPHVADVEEGRKLATEERAANRSTYLHLRDHGDGTHTGRFKLPSFHAAALRKMLQAFTAPRRADRSASEDATPRQTGDEPADEAPAPAPAPTPPERLGRAFCQLLERVPADWLPKAGGVSSTMVVLTDYDKLLSGLGAARLDTGEARPQDPAAHRAPAHRAGHRARWMLRRRMRPASRLV